MLVNLKGILIALDPKERAFDLQNNNPNQIAAVSAVLVTLEGIAEHEVFSSYDVESDDLAAVLDEMGTPAGWHPFITGYDAIPLLPDGLPSVPLDELARVYRVFS